MQPDHVLVIGFGGPTAPEEVMPFLREVARGRNIPEERLAEVRRHYEEVGGFSPYNRYTFDLVERLRKALESSGFVLPVFVGMRNWHPFLRETLSQIKSRGLKKGIGVILAPHRCEASYERYIRDVEEAKRHVPAAGIEYTYIRPWHDHPLFIKAQSDEVHKVLISLSAAEREKVYLLFTAHSIPLPMAQGSHYEEEFRTSSRLVASVIGHDLWGLAYQSRSGNPREPWLAPDVGEKLAELAHQGRPCVLAVPVGFLCDNAEVLYDLDIEARQAAEKLDLRFLRARTVTDHPDFVDMLRRLVEESLEARETVGRTRR